MLDTLTRDNATRPTAQPDAPRPLRTTRAELLPILRRMAMVAARRPSIPTLGHVRLTAADGVLRVTATNLDLALTETLPVDGPACDYTVHAATLLSLVARLPTGEALGLTLEPGERLRITAGRFTARLPVGPACDFPEMNAGDLPHRFELGADILRCLIERTRHAVSTEETRYYLNGIALQIHDARLTAITTDGHRLAIVSTALPSGAEALPSLILPRDALGPLLTLLGSGGEAVTVEASNPRLRFTLGHASLLTKTIDGTFPDWTRVIPAANPHVATINRDALATTIARVASLGTARRRPVKFTFAPGLTLSSQEPETGEAEEALHAADITYDGPEIITGFQARYLADTLRQIGGAVQMAMDDGTGPTLITDTADPHARFVLMPMRV